VNRTVLLAAAIVAAASTAGAQEAPRADAARRDQVRNMEMLLTSAVRRGAESLARTMQTSEPGSLIVTNTARTRGFVLEGFGVFFDVDVPMMKQSVVWSMQTLLRAQRRLDLQNFIANTSDGPARRQAELQLRQLERGGPVMPSPVPVPSAAPQPAPSGIAVAQTVEEPTAPAVPEPADPNEQYTEAVKASLIDAMLDYGGLPIADDEWLVVAARDSEGPPTPGALDDASTIMLKVKGSDLMAYRSNQITKEEARKKVEVREF
jgi:hypothetical protein